MLVIYYMRYKQGIKILKKELCEMKKLFCFLGLHNWNYIEVSRFSSMRDKVIGKSLTVGTRKCNWCSETQIETFHCLGMKPPEFKAVWYTLDKEGIM